MKMLHCVDAATTDETFVSSDNVQMIQVTDANTVIVYAELLHEILRSKILQNLWNNKL